MQSGMTVGLVLFCILMSVVQAEEQYHGHQVWNIVMKTATDVKNILDLEKQFQLDFWHIPRNLNDSFHVRVSPYYIDDFLSKLHDLNVASNVVIDDLQRLVDLEEAQLQRFKRSATTFDFTRQYYRYHEIVQYLDNLPSRSISADVKVGTLEGTTSEGNTIKYVKITKESGSSTNAIFMDCGIHAREWISPAFCMYVINQLTNGENVEVLSEYNWYIVPVLNPDGYEYSHSNTRFWRKNRRSNGDNECVGVDLNRNFGYRYNPAIGGSTDHCSDVYTGTGAFSEVESQAVQKFFQSASDDIFMYLTVHSYGQMFLYPWGFTDSELPSDYIDLNAAAAEAARVLRSVNRTKYNVGSSAQVLYPIAGGSDDWAKGSMGVKYSYTLELRDNGRYGFVLPADLIKPTVEETWAGVKALVKYPSGISPDF